MQIEVVAVGVVVVEVVVGEVVVVEVVVDEVVVVEVVGGGAELAAVTYGEEDTIAEEAVVVGKGWRRRVPPMAASAVTHHIGLSVRIADVVVGERVVDVVAGGGRVVAVVVGTCVGEGVGVESADRDK